MKKIFLTLLMLFSLITISSAESISTITQLDDGNYLYKSEVNNFEIKFLSDMQVNEVYANLYTRFYNDKVTIDVLIDDWSSKGSSHYSYITYGNKELVNDKYHKINYKRNIKVGNYSAYEMSYERDKLSRVENDKNYYYDLAINTGNKLTYTVLIKSVEPISNDLINIAKNIKITNEKLKKYELPGNLFKQITPKVNENTLKFYNEYFIDSNKITWGIFDVTTASNLDFVKSIEEKINHEFKFLIRYQPLTSSLPKEEIISSYKEGKVLEISLQTMNTAANQIDVYEILNGKYDEYFNQYAKDMKSTNVPILFRLNNEMNGDWCHYCSMYYAKDADLYKLMWRYIHDIFEANEVDNVLWVWNPNYKSFPRFTWNDQLMYYPGDEYVDIIGLTAYNTGNYYKGENWTCFYDLYNDYYKYIDRLTSKPLMITEFACSSYGGNKSQWIINMFNHLHLYPNIKVAIWWNHTDYDSNGNPARTYRMDTPEIMEIFKYYLNR